MRVYTNAEFHALPPMMQQMLRDGGWREEAVPEIEGPTPVVAAVATGSLPASSAEALCAQWEEKARDSQRLSGPCDEAGKIKFAAIADTLLACAAGLRRRMEAANVRQPEENTKVTGDGAQPRRAV